jgi:hypothetical protein
MTTKSFKNDLITKQIDDSLRPPKGYVTQIPNDGPATIRKCRSKSALTVKKAEKPPETKVVTVYIPVFIPVPVLVNNGVLPLAQPRETRYAGKRVLDEAKFLPMPKGEDEK